MAAALPRDILDAMSAPGWWGSWFARGDWTAWRAFLAATFALPMTEAEEAVYRACTGRSQLPSAPATEVWADVGRRGGKTRAMALTAAHMAVFGNFHRHLAGGETATVMLLAADRKQARVAMRYLRSLFMDHPGLKKLVIGETQESITLKNRVVIEIATASFRTTRGYTIAVVIADEIAFWRSEETSANPADEILAALRPAMATMPGALLLAASSPYARRGPLWDAYQRHYGRDGDPILVWKAPTIVMNPTVPRAVIDEAYERDPASAAAEYGAEFRTDVETFLPREVVEAAVMRDMHELAPAGHDYRAFCDPSGGVSDSMCVAIAHAEGDQQVLDLIREWRPPFSPDNVTQEIADILRRYGLSTVTADRYGSGWVSERFRVRGITVEPSELSASEIFVASLALFMSGTARIIQNDRLVNQLVLLERRTSRMGRDLVGHPPSSHDDAAVCACGALLAVSAPKSQFVFSSVESPATIARRRGLHNLDY